MKTWNVKYNGNEIRVENTWKAERLFINNKLHDEGRGITARSKLIGRLSEGQLVKVTIWGDFGMHCKIFVEDEIVLDK